jgi:hypothetical protein
MGFDAHEPQQRAMLRSAMQAAGISTADLWLHYFSLGGSAGEYEVEAYLQGLLSLPEIQRDLLAMAANELIEKIPRPRAPYSDELNGKTEPWEPRTAWDEESPSAREQPGHHDAE